MTTLTDIKKAITDVDLVVGADKCIALLSTDVAIIAKGNADITELNDTEQDLLRLCIRKLLDELYRLQGRYADSYNEYATNKAIRQSTRLSSLYLELDDLV